MKAKPAVVKGRRGEAAQPREDVHGFFTPTFTL
jgi:hypothetical protein